MTPAIPFRDALRVWAKIGLLGFGGPAGQIALMHKELVEKRRWLDEARFLHALNYCMLLPGPEAQQLATYIGWLLHGTRGGLAAGLLFILPGFVAILGLSILYATTRSLPVVNGLFFGLKAAVLALVVEALIRIGKRALSSIDHVVIAALAFIAIFFLGAPFPLVVLVAAAAGFVLHRAGREVIKPPKADPMTDGQTVVEAMAARGELAHTRPSRARALRVIVVAGLLWGGPVALALATLGPHHVLTQQALFFSQAAVVTFGGAYAVLAWVAQRAVLTYGWLQPGEMLDGLGLAETTPGPLIMVLQFVGFMGAFRLADAHGADPLLLGIAGSVVTVWVTFVPCFFWIFLGAPYIESLRANRSLQAALSGITAAVVGVIANLSLWLWLHTLFGTVTDHEVGPLTFHVPDFGTLDGAALVLSVVALVAVLRFHLSLGWTLGGAAVLGLVWKGLA